jgi:hypothetical protein
MSEALIRAEIKTILEAVSGIGVVHAYERYSRSLAEFFSLMTSGGKVNGWMIHRVSTDSRRETYPMIWRYHEFKIMAIYELDDVNASEVTFQAILDAIFEAFKSKNTLNGTALDSEPVSIDSVETEEYGNRLFHTAVLTLTACERATYT